MARKPVEILNPEGRGAVVVICEHASNHIPSRYDGLLLSEADKQSHAAWDPGARDMAWHLSRALDAPMIASRISRLVYDCNRPPESPDAMRAVSETVEIPGNRNLTADERAERVERVYLPFCEAVASVLDARARKGLPTAIVTVHSFTPVYFDTKREVEIGILHDRDSRLADAMLAGAGLLPHRVVRRNDPYGPQDGVTHSLNLHGNKRNLPNVMLEVRNDLIVDDAGVRTLSDELLSLLMPALKTVMQVSNV